MAKSLESSYQHSLIKRIEKRLPGAIILKNDPNYLQGIPDLTIFWKDKWATLECKRSSKERRQPNQEYYVDKMNGMSFSAFIFPENEEDVLDALQRTFGA